jgi:hypothetical protein
MPWFSFQLQVGNNEGARRRLHMYSQFLLQNGISEVRLYVPRTSQEDGILPSTKAPGSISSATEDASSGSSTTTLVSKGIKATEKSNSESLEETNGNDGYVRIALYSSTPKSVDEWLRIYHIVNSQPQMMQSKDSTSIIEISSPLTGPPVGTSAISGKTAQIRKIPGTGGDSFNKEGNLTASSEVMKLSTSGVSESSQDRLNKPVSSSTGSSSDGTLGAKVGGASLSVQPQLVQPRAISAYGFRPLGGSANVSLGRSGLATTAGIPGASNTASCPGNVRGVPMGWLSVPAQVAPSIRVASAPGGQIVPRILIVPVAVRVITILSSRAGGWIKIGY